MITLMEGNRKQDKPEPRNPVVTSEVSVTKSSSMTKSSTTKGGSSTKKSPAAKRLVTETTTKPPSTTKKTSKRAREVDAPMVYGKRRKRESALNASLFLQRDFWEGDNQRVRH